MPKFYETCFVQQFFTSSGYCGLHPGVLVGHPLIAFTKLTDKQYHKDAVVRSDEFLKVMTQQQPDEWTQPKQAMARQGHFKSSSGYLPSSKMIPPIF